MNQVSVCEGLKVEIRKATVLDYNRIVRSIQNKHIAYITPAHVREDIRLNRQYIMTDNGKMVAMISLVWDSDYNYFALKRLCVPNKRNRGKGFAKLLVTHMVNSMVGNKVGCTPWSSNSAVRHLLEKLGFNLEYIFDEKWCFYSKYIH